MLALGIDIGGTSVKAALVRESRVASTGQSDSYVRPDGAALQHAVNVAVRAALARVSEPVTAIGLCVPGLFDQASRAITLSVNLPGVVGLNLDALAHGAIAGQAGLPKPRVVTDAYAAAFDFWSEAQPEGRFLAVVLGTGVGACVLDDGKPLTVVGHSPGHIGQLDVTVADDALAPLGPDGGRGSLEAYIGIPALRARYGPSFGPSLLAASTEKPPLAALVRALRICHAMYRPQSIALLGGIGLLLRPRISDLSEAVARDLTSVARPGWTLTSAQNTFHAASGAARLALRELL